GNEGVMKFTAKYLLIGVVLVATLVVVLLLLPRKKDDSGHLSLIPENTVALAALDLERIFAKAGEDQLSALNNLFTESAAGDPVLVALARNLITASSGSGLNPQEKGIVFLGIVGQHSYLGVVLALKNDKSIRTQLMKAATGSGTLEKVEGYRIFIRHGVLVAWKKTALIILNGNENLSAPDLRKEFLRLAALSPDQQFFSVHQHASELVSKESDLLCWADVKTSASSVPVLKSWKWPGNIPESVSDILLDVNFHNGKVTLDAELFAEERSEVVNIHGRAAQVERLLQYHQPENLLLALSLAKNDESPFPGQGDFPGMSAGHLYKLIEKNIPVRGIEELSSAIRERVMLSVTHPPSNIGKMLDDVFSNRAEEDNPFAKLNPDVRMTMIIDPVVFDSLLPGMIRNKMFAKEGDMYRFMPGRTRVPFISSSATVFYAKAIDDILLIGNRKEFVANSGPVSGDAVSEFTEVQKREYANHNLTMHLNVDQLYEIFGSMAPQGGPAALLGQTELVNLRIDPSRVRMVVDFSDNNRNSLNLLLSELFSK
ncbi:MAG: DUF4836 family protein, partial [Bacteroidales bacterium]